MGSSKAARLTLVVIMLFTTSVHSSIYVMEGCTDLCELITDMSLCESQRGWLGGETEGIRTRCCELIEKRSPSGKIVSNCVSKNIDNVVYDSSDKVRLEASSHGVNTYFKNVMDIYASTKSYETVEATNKFYVAPNGDSGSTKYGGPYAKQRTRIDYNWHIAPADSRREFQDNLVSKNLATGCMCTKPWLIFTAGAMGSGKGYVHKWLVEQGILRKDKYVTIDLDAIRESLPEFALMKHLAEDLRLKSVAKKKEAQKLKPADPKREALEIEAQKLFSQRSNLLNKMGWWTQRESGMIQEVMDSVAKDSSMCALIDGSLQDKAWWADTVWPRTRKDYPQYRIMILYVWTEEQTAIARALSRAKEEGRQVPRETIERSARAVPESVRALRDMSELTIYIDNNADMSAPKLKAIYMNNDPKEIKEAHEYEIKVPYEDPENFDANWDLVREAMKWGGGDNDFCDCQVTKLALELSGLSKVCPAESQELMVRTASGRFNPLSISKRKKLKRSKQHKMTRYYDKSPVNDVIATFPYDNPLVGNVLSGKDAKSTMKEDIDGIRLDDGELAGDEDNGASPDGRLDYVSKMVDDAGYIGGDDEEETNKEETGSLRKSKTLQAESMLP